MEQIKRMELQTVEQLGYNPYQPQMASHHVAKAAIEKAPPGALSSGGPLPPPSSTDMAGGGDSLDRSNTSTTSTATSMSWAPISEAVLQDPNVSKHQRMKKDERHRYTPQQPRPSALSNHITTAIEFLLLVIMNRVNNHH